ncbi:MAG: AAA family ATPase, partial [Pseudonocardia sp.]|uniref:AAA family ATPase n=2 Tax=unclassified Pseudonocardia TaxID=2619320 RepID=UPI001ACE44FE
MPRAHLRLRLLGPFTVEGGSSDIVPVGKARRVLAVLAERPGEFVSVGDLVEALWESAAPQRADRNVAALVSRLRKVLGRERIDGTATGYRLVATDLSTDLAEAIEHVERAELELGHGRFAVAVTGAELATGLLAADVALSGEQPDRWVSDVRLRVARYCRRARICWAAAALELGTPEVTVDVASAALDQDPLDEEACRLVMTGLVRAGRPADARAAYEALEAAVSEQLGCDPSPATRALLDTTRPTDEPVAEPEPIVGRDAQLDTLRGQWARSSDGRPGLVVVTGEGGVGRSALVERFADEQRHDGALVLSVACHEAERSLYLEPLVQLVRAALRRVDPADVLTLAGSRLGALAQLVPEVGDIVAATDYERADPELEHGRALDAFAGFLARLSATRPVLVTIEDAHHAGRSTIGALRFAMREWAADAGARPVLVVVTERGAGAMTEPLRELATEWIELGPLDVDAVADLVARAGTDHDPARLHAWTGGSPLFVAELLRSPGPALAGDGPVPVPPSLRDIVADRIEAADEEIAELLGQAAVLGASFTLDALAQLTGTEADRCATRAAEAVRIGLLHPLPDGMRFVNDVVRQVAYEATPTPVRISRHRRAARLLDARPESAARHFAAAGDWSSAARAWTDAAAAAARAFANTEAVELLSKAVGAARSADDVTQLVHTLVRRGRACSQIGRYADAVADHEQALELARGRDDPELEALALEQLGWTALYARDAMAAVDLAEQATEVAESAAAAPGALPSATLLLGRVRHWDGDYDGAGKAYEQVLDCAPDDSTRAMALAYRGALLQHLDRFAEARTVLARAAALCRRTGEFRPLLQTLFFTALARGDSGDFSGALRALDNARRLIDAEKLGFYRAGIETATSWLWQELGNPHRA